MGNGREVGPAGVPVPDVRCEELPESLCAGRCPQEYIRQVAAAGADGRELPPGDSDEFAHGHRSSLNRPCARRYPNSSGSKKSAGSISMSSSACRPAALSVAVVLTSIGLGPTQPSAAGFSLCLWSDFIPQVICDNVLYDTLPVSGVKRRLTWKGALVEDTYTQAGGAMWVAQNLGDSSRLLRRVPRCEPNSFSRGSRFVRARHRRMTSGLPRSLEAGTLIKENPYQEHNTG